MQITWGSGSVPGANQQIINLRKQLSQLAAQHNSMTLQIQNYVTQIAEMESSVRKITS